MDYKYELHCHTSAVSLCADITPKELVAHYEKAGYSGLVLTDHYSPMTFLRYGMTTPKRSAEHYLKAYHELKDYCGDGFTVLLGMELRHYATVNDYLIYGVDERWLAHQHDMLFWGEEKMSRRMHEAGYLVYQAHPFRPLITRCDTKLLDGIEVFNGHTSLDNNAKALNWARQNGMNMITGTDCHSLTDEPKGGIITQKPIKNNADLLDTLRKCEYSLPITSFFTQTEKPKDETYLNKKLTA